MTIDRGKLKKAKEWADYLNAQRDVYGDMVSEARVAAEVIAALPDTIVDDDKLWEIARNVEAATPGFPAEYQGKLRTWARRLNALLPDQAPRTLADIPWDDDEHTYMEAVTVSGRRYIILAPMGKTAVSDNTILAAERGGGLPVLVPAECLTPLPDLPRMVWPDEHHPATDTEETPEPAQPRPEDVPVKEPWLVEFRGERYIGARDQYDAPNWALARMDGTNIHFADDHEVTLVSRLAQEGDV